MRGRGSRQIAGSVINLCEAILNGGSTVSHESEAVRFSTLEVGDEFSRGNESLMKLPDGVLFGGMTCNALILCSRNRFRGQPVNMLPDTTVYRVRRVVPFRFRLQKA